MAVAAPAVQDLGRGARAFGVCAAAFLLAGIVAAVVHAVAPIPHGWWLVAYLVLVGAVAQAALGVGLAALARQTGSHPPAPSAARAELVLFNAGTVLVAVTDVAGVSAGVLAGSVLTLAALGLFTAGLREVARSARRPARLAVVAYGILLAFLAGSVFVGAALAAALPGQ